MPALSFWAMLAMCGKNGIIVCYLRIKHRFFAKIVWQCAAMCVAKYPLLHGVHNKRTTMYGLRTCSKFYAQDAMRPPDVCTLRLFDS